MLLILFDSNKPPNNKPHQALMIALNALIICTILTYSLGMTQSKASGCHSLKPNLTIFSRGGMAGTEQHIDPAPSSGVMGNQDPSLQQSLGAWRIAHCPSEPKWHLGEHRCPCR